MQLQKTPIVDKALVKSSYTILIYQTDNQSELLGAYLNQFGYQTIMASNENLYAKLEMGNYDLCILDYFNNELGNLKPLEYLKEINENIPSIILAQRLANTQFEYTRRIKAFNLGADDYVPRPYYMDEILARIKVLLSLYARLKTAEENIVIGIYTYDMYLKEMRYNDHIVKLTPQQHTIFKVLYANLNNYIPVLSLYNAMRQTGTQQGVDVDNVFRTQVSALRNILRFDSRIIIDMSKGFVGMFYNENKGNKSLF